MSAHVQHMRDAATPRIQNFTQKEPQGDLRPHLMRARCDVEVKLRRFDPPLNDFRVQIRVITPAFLRLDPGKGSVPNKLDDVVPLRPTSVRGALRYWYRMLVGSALECTDSRPESAARLIEVLRREENKVFGSTEAKSAVAIGVPQLREGNATTALKAGEIKPLLYLGYGPLEARKLTAEVIAPGATFDIPLHLRRLHGLTNSHLQMLACSIWLWTHLGGIGGRSRRGFGSLQLCQMKGLPWTGPSLTELAATPQEYLNYLGQGVDHCLEIARTHVRSPAGAGGARHPDVRVLDDLKSLRALPQPFSKPHEAMARLSFLFQTFRSTLERRKYGLPPLPDYHTVKAALQQKQMPTEVPRAAFGLPLRFYYRSLGGSSVTFVPSLGRRGQKNVTRMPSPLIFRVHPLANMQYTAVMLAFTQRRPLLTADLAAKGLTGMTPGPTAQLIDEFMNWAVRNTKLQASASNPGLKRP